MDVEKVRRKALEMGLATAEALAAMHREEILLLTTLPGFTTAETVTEVSGRGVGLDAVRTKVESWGGLLALYSVPGAGTTVAIKIPLSLAIIRVLIVSSAGRTFALPVTRIHHTLELFAENIRTSGALDYVRDGRSLIRLERLSSLLGIAPPGPSADHGPVVVMEKGRRRVGFLVDDILGTRDAVIKPLGQPLTRIPALTGAAILGDGRPVIVLDALRLV
jgi:two-component system chemotaxis sensor kinase CheA